MGGETRPHELLVTKLIGGAMARVIELDYKNEIVEEECRRSDHEFVIGSKRGVRFKLMWIFKRPF